MSISAKTNKALHKALVSGDLAIAEIYSLQSLDYPPQSRVEELAGAFSRIALDLGLLARQIGRQNPKGAK